MKRLLDVVLGGIAAIVAAPLVALLALAVRLDSPGPALFRQTRVGRGGRPFTLLKLRTMVVDAERRGPGITAGGDARITRVGAFLRRYKLDELPQLLNVLRGEMSLVGPRPELPSYVARYPLADRDVVLSVRPGLTDPASLALLDEGELLRASENPERYYVEQLLPFKIAMYRQYVETRSLAGDLAILARTLMGILSPRRTRAGIAPGSHPLPSPPPPAARSS